MQTWIGTSGFQYPEWKGTFYPEDLAAAMRAQADFTIKLVKDAGIKPVD